MDENTKPRRRARLLIAGVAGAAALGLATAGSAAADTSVATANAVTVGAVGTTAVSSGTAKASSDGTTTTQTPALSTLNGQGGVTAGTLTQSAVARNDGSSAACAGLVGAGGVVTVGADGSCTVAGGGSGGVQITLVPGTPAVTGPLGNVLVPAVPATVIKADAILASCSATSAPSAASKVVLTNAAVYTGGALVLNLTAAPTPNSTLSVTGIATLGLHTAPSKPTGTVQATALTINLLSGTAAAVNVGTVTCGANAKTVPTDALPGPAAPLSAVALAALGWRFRRPVLHALSTRSTSRG